jgi:hypothetical protein
MPPGQSLRSDSPDIQQVFIFMYFFKDDLPRTDGTILKIFSPKNLAKIIAFFAQTTVRFCKKCDHNMGF